MAHLLQIKSSIYGEDSITTKLSNQFVEAWKAMDPARTVTVRDLIQAPIAHLKADGFRSFLSPPDELTDEQRAVLDLSNTLIAELKAADVVVFGASMYNSFIPSVLKAYIDHVIRAGVTFKYTETGPVGMLTGKRAVVVSARGGAYEGTDFDFIKPYFSFVLPNIGFEDVQFILAEGLDMGEEARTRGLEAAQAQLQTVLKRFAPDNS